MRPLCRGIVVIEESFTTFFLRGVRGFHLVPFPAATSSVKRAAIVAGASVLR